MVSHCQSSRTGRLILPLRIRGRGKSLRSTSANKSALETTLLDGLRQSRQFGTANGANQYLSTIDAPPAAEQCCLVDSKPERSTSERSLVSVVDDDESVRESLPDLLREFGFAARAFSSAEAFLSSDCVEATRCLILDVAMPRMTGLDLQQELTRRGQKIPIIFITAKRDEAIRAKALERGAVKFLYKPFSDTALLDALNAVFQAN